MCYRASSTSDVRTLEKRFRASFAEPADREVYHHVAGFLHPRLPVIAASAPERIGLYHWGLIPGWVRTGEQALLVAGRTLNARLETAAEKPAFRDAVARRCLVLVDGFFEFREVAGKKYPYFIRLRTGEPFALGGLAGVWTDPECGDEYPTFTVLTSEASSLLAQIHNTKRRMPLLLSPGAGAAWLQNGTGPDLLPDEALDAYPVSRDLLLPLNRANHPDVTKRVDYPALYDGHILSER